MSYKVVCSRCEKYIGESSEEPNVPVCKDCYYGKKERKKSNTHLKLIKK